MTLSSLEALIVKLFSDISNTEWHYYSEIKMSHVIGMAVPLLRYKIVGNCVFLGPQRILLCSLALFR